ncbi:MAG: cysteine--tRNA ligase [Novosphingobium sp.]|nr:cysteine--tRNA ligase [Novosphingobium sp.]
MNNFKLYLTNTLTGITELFKPSRHKQISCLEDNSKENNSSFQDKSKIKKIDLGFSVEDKKVTMYVCGITPYDYAHLGHGRCYVTFDVLYRLFNFMGYKVEYCRNFTDIDDKIIKKAEAEFQDPNKYPLISSKFIDAYEEDMKKLNCLSPTYEPRVTENIPAIISFIEILLNKNYAYSSDSGVYYDVQAFKDYGKLSKRNLNDLKAGARVEIREDKKSPLDFALWKKVSVQEPGWDSPWGYGRPGWHIECSALIEKYLKIPIDIHGGGMDLIFPHHENEIAQSEAAFCEPLAQYWIHNAFILLDKEKMSKSLGNFFTLRDVFGKFDPVLLRYYFLNHHYRSPIEFSFDDINMLIKSYQRLVRSFTGVESKDIRDIKDAYKSGIAQELLDALLSDLNVSKFWGILFQNLKALELESNLDKNKQELIAIKSLIQNILGITLEPLIICDIKNNIEITPEIQSLIDQRDEARRSKDWAKSDSIRDQLKKLGFVIQDKKRLD